MIDIQLKKETQKILDLIEDLKKTNPIFDTFEDFFNTNPIYTEQGLEFSRLARLLLNMINVPMTAEIRDIFLWNRYSTIIYFSILNDSKDSKDYWLRIDTNDSDDRVYFELRLQSEVCGGKHVDFSNGKKLGEGVFLPKDYFTIQKNQE